MAKFILEVLRPNENSDTYPEESIEFNDDNLDRGLITFVIGNETYCMELGKYMLAGSVIGSLKPQAK